MTQYWNLSMCLCLPTGIASIISVNRKLEWTELISFICFSLQSACNLLVSAPACSSDYESISWKVRKHKSATSYSNKWRRKRKEKIFWYYQKATKDSQKQPFRIGRWEQRNKVFNKRKMKISKEKICKNNTKQNEHMKSWSYVSLAKGARWKKFQICSKLTWVLTHEL